MTQPRIKYVCMSDMHFGEEDSLLTNLRPASWQVDVRQPSPVAGELARCIHHLTRDSEGPSLILNGDILELAIANFGDATNALRRFLELVSGLFEELLYIPGNHDHHIWQVTRDMLYNSMLEDRVPLREPHATGILLEDTLEPALFDSLCRPATGEACRIRLAYPNLALTTADHEHCVVFHHGHYLEDVYRAMSMLSHLLFPGRAEPASVHEWEEENHAWIHFLWSALGRSGLVGRHVEQIYELTRSPRDWDRFIKGMSQQLADIFDIPLLPGTRMEARAIYAILSFLSKRVLGERHREDQPHEDQPRMPLQRGIQRYLFGPVWTQLHERCHAAGREFPRSLSFVIGHTHKPFEWDTNRRGWPEWIPVYNTGGWTVDETRPCEQHGASLVLVDEQLNLCAVRLHCEIPGRLSLRVAASPETLARPGGREFFSYVQTLVDPHAAPWNHYLLAAADGIRRRKLSISRRIAERD